MSDRAGPAAAMIYGANGYTGRRIAEEAVRRGAKPILAGRNADAIGKLAAELDCPSRVFGLSDVAQVAERLAGVRAVLHCAGPFSATAEPMIDACLAAGMHYLDITGEIAAMSRRGQSASVHRRPTSAVTSSRASPTAAAWTKHRRRSPLNLTSYTGIGRVSSPP